MSRLFSTGFELNSTTTGVEGDTYNLVSISSTTVRSGTYALRANAAANAPFWRTQILSADSSSAICYFRTYLYIASSPSANTQIMRIVNSSNVQQAIVQLTTTNTLQLRNGSTTQVGSDSAALSINTWYRVEISWNPSTGATEARLDGSSFASGTGTTGSWSRVIVGCITGNPNADLFFDDIAINDNSGSNQTGFPGSGKIIHLRPAANGDTVQYATGVGGTGTAPAGNYTRVNEVTPNNGTSYNQSNTTNQIDHFTLDPTPGSMGSSDTINVVSVGMRFSGNGAASASLAPQLESQASGTLVTGSTVAPTATGVYITNALAAPFNYGLTSYTDPQAGGPWTKALLDAAQAGYKTIASSTSASRVSTVWVLVDYTPNASASQVKTLAGTAQASVKTAISVANASAKKILGVTNV